MNEREEQILQAAWTIFLRYGVKRTGMADIASEAGISRQTLYNTFKGKNDILDAMIAAITAKSIARIEEVVEEGKPLPDVLDVVFNEMVIQPYELVEQLPNSNEFVESEAGTAKEAMNRAHADYVVVLTHILAPYEAALLAVDETLETYAEFIQVTACAAKKMVRDRAHLDMILRTLKATILRTVSV